MSRKLHLVFAAAAALCCVSTAQALELTSPDLSEGGHLKRAQVNSHCGGGNRSPALHWVGAPKQTRSFALTLFDSDANGGHGFWHWLVFDIPADADGLPEGAGSGNGLPAGAVQAKNDFGTVGYGGACPPPGPAHHYTFTLYALASPAIAVTANKNDGALASWLKAQALASATLAGTYAR